MNCSNCRKNNSNRYHSLEMKRTFWMSSRSWRKGIFYRVPLLNLDLTMSNIASLHHTSRLNFNRCSIYTQNTTLISTCNLRKLVCYDWISLEFLRIWEADHLHQEYRSGGWICQIPQWSCPWYRRILLHQREVWWSKWSFPHHCAHKSLQIQPLTEM